MTTLQRITTAYVDNEDRLRLAGEIADTTPVVIWLTRRLLDRLLPVLLRWLEIQTPGKLGEVNRVCTPVIQSFAQQVAYARLVPQIPVSYQDACQSWLAESVDVVRTRQTVLLEFRSSTGEHASMALSIQPLRQWLGIVYRTYRRAGWSLDIWPAWVQEGFREGTSRKAVPLH